MSEARPSTAVWIDPVCGMEVSGSNAAATATHAGKLYYFCSAGCRNRFDASPDEFLRTPASRAPADTTHAMAAHAPPGPVTANRDLAKDPICGMMVSKATALSSERSGRKYYFCSVGCQRTFESPERELESMKDRKSVV